MGRERIVALLRHNHRHTACSNNRTRVLTSRNSLKQLMKNFGLVSDLSRAARLAVLVLRRSAASCISRICRACATRAVCHDHRPASQTPTNNGRSCICAPTHLDHLLGVCRSYSHHRREGPVVRHVEHLLYLHRMDVGGCETQNTVRSTKLRVSIQHLDGCGAWAHMLLERQRLKEHDLGCVNRELQQHHGGGMGMCRRY